MSGRMQEEEFSCPKIFPNHSPKRKTEGNKINGRVSYQNVTKKHAKHLWGLA